MASTAPGDHAGAIAAVREQFPDVPRRTWDLWVSQKTQLAPKLKKQVAVALEKVEQVCTAEVRTPDHTPAPDAPRRRRRAAAAVEGVHLPASPPSAGTVATGGPGDGTTTRFTKPPPVQIEPTELIATLGELMLDADALRDCSMRVSPDGHGHVIVDPVSFAQSVAMRLQITVAQGKMYGAMMSSEKAKDILSAIIGACEDLAPDVKIAVVAKIREAVAPFRSDLNIAHNRKTTRRQ